MVVAAVQSPLDLFPEQLLEAPPMLPWWVAYTRSRQEKQLASKLRQLGVSHYCPLIHRRTRGAKGRINQSIVPLFSNYLFLCGSPEDRVTALQTNLISRIIDVPRIGELVSDLRQIRGLILSGSPVTPEDRLAPGDRIRVRSGPFKGYEGYVVQRHGQTRLIVDVRFMNQGASVQVEDCMVELI